MARRIPRRRSAASLLVAAAGAMGFLAVGPSFVPSTARGRSAMSRMPLRAEVEVVTDTGDASLAKLETQLQAQIELANKGENPEKLKDLARLLVLAKTAEGIAVKEGAKDGAAQMKSAIAESLASFVGKEDYTMSDVTKEIRGRCSTAVAALDDIYLEDIAKEMSLAGEAAVAGFTGKEEYKFGDISKEVDARAKTAVAKFTGKEDYKFGDITKEFLSRGGDAVKDFTGKDEYKFGDITKTVFKNIFGGGDDKK